MRQLEDLKDQNQREGHRKQVFELVFVKDCAFENGPTLSRKLEYAFQRRPEYFYAGKQSPSNT